MKEKKTKYLIRLLILLLVISGGYIIYQNSELKRIDEQLKYTIHNSLEEFATLSQSANDEASLEKQYGKIELAHNAYCALSRNKGIPEDEYEYNLAALLLNIKDVMCNDKGKYIEVFSNPDVHALMFMISDNYEDRESINKINKLLENRKKELITSKMVSDAIDKVEIEIPNGNLLSDMKSKIITNRSEIEGLVRLFNNASLMGEVDDANKEDSLGSTYKFYCGDNAVYTFSFNGCDSKKIYLYDKLLYVDYGNKEKTPYDLYKESTAQAINS